MPSASALRQQIEASLASRIPSALSPIRRHDHPLADTGIPAVDLLLQGGLPVGGITEMVGAECSGRTTLATSFLAQRMKDDKYCAWVDVSDTFDPASGSAKGIDLTRLLWIRCGIRASLAPIPPMENAPPLLPCNRVPTPVKGLHGGGFGPHPRTEIKGLSEAVNSLLIPGTDLPRDVSTSTTSGTASLLNEPLHSSSTVDSPAHKHYLPTTRNNRKSPQSAWSAMDKALLVTDILLQAGGFDSIVLDMASMTPQHVSRIPLSTWFRYRAAAAKHQSSILLLTQHACTQSSSDLVLTFSALTDSANDSTILGTLEYCIEVTRNRRVAATDNILPIRKPPKSEPRANWKSRTTWGCALDQTS